MDELGSDPDIELAADKVTPEILFTMADDIPNIWKRTKPALIVSGKKLKLTDEKIVASDSKSMASIPLVQSEPETSPMISNETYSRDVSCCTPFTITVTKAKVSFRTRDFST